MKMCLKLAHYAFLSPPSKGTTMSTFCVFFFTFCWRLNLFMSFSLPKRVCKSLWVCSYMYCVSVSVCVHPLNKDVSQAIIGSFLHCVLQKMVRWVALRFVIALCWSWNRLKCDGQCLFLSYCNSCSACESHSLRERDVLGNTLIVDHHVKKNLYICTYSLGQLERL